MQPGAWAGSVTYADQNAPRKLTTQEKWDKTKQILQWAKEHVDSGTPMVRKLFRSKTGFLLHTVDTYDVGSPYLQGFFLSLNAWRPDRDADGYRIHSINASSDASQTLDDKDEGIEDEDHLLLDVLENECEGSTLQEECSGASRQTECDDKPALVHPVPRLGSNINALMAIFKGETPAQLLLQPVRGAFSVVYGSGNASGEGFGSLVLPLGMEPLFKMGFWCSEASEKSSNWREFRNLLERLRSEAALGRLTGKEIWIATDNSTADKAFYKGRSPSPELDSMVLDL